MRLLRAAKSPLSMRQIEERIDQKRLTLLYNLRKLEKRGWVRQDRSRRIYTWALNFSNVASTGTHVPPEEVYALLAKTSSQKLWGIQGAGALRQLTQKIHTGTSYIPMHHRQRLRRMVVDALIPARGVDILKSMPKRELASHLRRPTILHMTADAPALDNLEILTDGKTLFVIDHDTGRAALTNQAAFVTAYIGLHETIKSLSTKVRPQDIYGDL